MYETFAYVYDNFMEDVPYKQWVDYIEEIWRKFNIAPHLVLDLACGTGQVTVEMAKRGYDMIGIDLSYDMLDVAKEKAYEQNLDILFIQQDMREFELYGTVSSILSVCDSMNYLLDQDELLETFKLVNNYLDPGGLFIFDVNTLYKYEKILGENTFTDVQNNCAYIWDNYYDEEEQLNQYALTLFHKVEKDLYRKFEEVHYQRAYTIDIIKELINKAGLELLAVYDAFTFDEPKEDSERVYFIAREKEKVKQS